MAESRLYKIAHLAIFCDLSLPYSNWPQPRQSHLRLERWWWISQEDWGVSPRAQHKT